MKCISYTDSRFNLKIENSYFASAQELPCQAQMACQKSVQKDFSG